MHTIYLVRHGQTEWNSTGFYQGYTNVPLNETGIAQAEAVAKELASVHFDTIIASDLDRARITAETILGERQIPFRTDERLREINFGDWEGLTYDQIEAKWPQAVYTMYRSPDKVKISNGESFQDVQLRAWEALREEMSQVGEDKTILVVAHGGTNRTLICKMLNLPLHFAWNFSQGNTSISRIEFYGLTEDDHNTLSLLNYTKHLESLIIK